MVHSDMVIYFGLSLGVIQLVHPDGGIYFGLPLGTSSCQSPLQWVSNPKTITLTKASLRVTTCTAAQRPRPRSEAPAKSLHRGQITTAGERLQGQRPIVSRLFKRESLQPEMFHV